VPIAATRQVHADLVIAIDVNGPPLPKRVMVRHEAEVEVEGEAAEVEEASGYRARISGWIESIVGSRGEVVEEKQKPVEKPGLIDLMGRSLDTMQAQIARMQLALDPPDILVRMPRDRCAFYEFWRAAELVELGRESLVEVLDEFERRNGD